MNYFKKTFIILLFSSRLHLWCFYYLLVCKYRFISQWMFALSFSSGSSSSCLIHSLFSRQSVNPWRFWVCIFLLCMLLLLCSLHSSTCISHENAFKAKFSYFFFLQHSQVLAVNLLSLWDTKKIVLLFSSSEAQTSMKNLKFRERRVAELERKIGASLHYACFT